jgi:hypothetical protein
LQAVFAQNQSAGRKISCNKYERLNQKRDIKSTKRPRNSGAAIFLQVFLIVLRKADCFVGANVCTGATLGAKIRVDGVDVTLGDGLGGAFADTRTASNAVFANYISHSL